MPAAQTPDDFAAIGGRPRRGQAGRRAFALAAALVIGVAAAPSAKAQTKAPQATHAAKPKPDAAAKPAARTEPGKTDAGAAAAAPAQPAAEPPPPPYEPQILRLAEILGALAWLDDLCGANAGWRMRMQQLIEAEAKTRERKERLAGSFNRGFHDYEMSYQTCTPNAEIAIGRFLSEGDRLARDVANRFGAS